MKYDTIDVSIENLIATVKLDRPEVHNAMNESMMKELKDCFNKLSKDKKIRAIILTGEGKSFCAGADLNWMKSMVNYSKEENEKDSRLLLDLYESIYDCPKPVIGKINGHAFGGGIGLVAVCDLTIGVFGSKFAFSEVNLGIIPSVISTFVQSRIKLADMRRLFITGERFETDYAKEMGLLDHICKQEEVEEKIQFYVKMIMSSGPNAIKEIKKLTSNLRKLSIDEYKKYTVEKISELRVSKEGQEGINAFLEKRKPNWRD